MAFLLKLHYQNYVDEEKHFLSKEAAKAELEKAKKEGGLLSASLFKMKLIDSWVKK
jgi:hypothetical protein